MPDKDDFRLAPYPTTSTLDDTDVMLLENADGTDSKILGSVLKSIFVGLSEVVDDATPQLGGDLDLNGNNIDFPTTANIADCHDEDDMTSDDPLALSTQQSIKAYGDSATQTMTNKTMTSPVLNTPSVNGQTLSVATGTVTTGEILALNGTPIELIATPGANKAIVVDEIQLFLDFNSAGYAADAAEDLTIEYSAGTDIAVIDNDVVTFLTAVADAHWIGKNFAIYDVSVAGTGDGVLLGGFDNEAVDMTIATGNVITGDSPIKYRITYHVVDFLT